MEYRFKWDKIVIGCLLILIVCIGTIFISRQTSKAVFLDINKSSGSVTNNEKVGKKVQKVINKVIEDNNNLVLAYETTKIKEFKCYTYQDNDRYKSIIINTKTGEIVDFDSLIKKDKKEAFNNKIKELLQKKYPEFIVNSLLTNEGTNFYYIKDNEVVIFYYDYIIPYDYNELIYLKVNYNEIKDMLNFTPYLDLEYSNESGYNYDPSKKTITFTFDDGPSYKYNSLFLDALEKNKAHATFFMVGNMMNSCQTCVLNTYKSGNEVASHTYNHLNIKKASLEEVNTNLKQVDDLYYSITNDTIKLVRPPYGSYNKTNLENVNKPFILWNLDTEDWRYRDKEHIINYIKENVSDGSIILMHELYESTYEAVLEILPWLYANGYNVVSVSELAKLKGRNIEVGKSYSSFK